VKEADGHAAATDNDVADANADADADGWLRGRRRQRHVQWAQVGELASVREYLVVAALTLEQQEAILAAERADAEEEARDTGVGLVDYGEEGEDDDDEGGAETLTRLQAAAGGEGGVG
tara:strand:- start:72 stop:425 length:354 start_codon:yes stop_codon:yes gene_type:complete